jgi:hypothetical protein
MGIGAVTGFANGVGSQFINQGKIAGWSGVGGLVADTVLGAGENAAGTGIQNASGDNLTLGNALSPWPSTARRSRGRRPDSA